MTDFESTFYGDFVGEDSLHHFAVEPVEPEVVEVPAIEVADLKVADGIAEALARLK